MKYKPMIDEVADVVVTDADYKPVTTKDVRLRECAADLRSILNEIQEHTAKAWLVDGELPKIDWEEYRMQMARLHGHLQAEATHAAITIEVWCDEE